MENLYVRCSCGYILPINARGGVVFGDYGVVATVKTFPRHHGCKRGVAAVITAEDLIAAELAHGAIRTGTGSFINEFFPWGVPQGCIQRNCPGDDGSYPG